MPRRIEDIVKIDHHKAPEAAVERAPKPKVAKLTPPQEDERPTRRSAGRKRGTGTKKAGMWLLAVIVVVAVAASGFLASTRFSRATFTLVPVSVAVALSGSTIVATGTSTQGYLRYEVVKYSGAASTTIPAADGTVTSSKASGSVTIFNYYSKEGQRLVAGTRFAGDNGLVYRLSGSVFVPGYSSASSPGTIKASVVADQAGTQYNIARNDGGTIMRIVAYKGSPRYDGIYARSYLGMSGGFSGTKKIVNQTLLASTTEDLQSALTKSLAAQAMARVPDGYVTYPSAYSTSFAPTDVDGPEPKKAVVTMTGTLYSVMFKKTELAAALAGQDKVSKFGKSPYSTNGIEGLSFSISNPSTFKPAKMNALIAKFSGSMNITGIIPVAEITKKLAGVALTDTKQIFASYGSVIDISKSSGELFPSWASAVPNDESRIKVDIKDPS